MNVVSDFARKHSDARSALAALVKEVEAARWSDLAQLKNRYPKASFVGKDQFIFDIRGGHYRLHARVSFSQQLFIVVRLGTHAEYDNWTY